MNVPRTADSLEFQYVFVALGGVCLLLHYVSIINSVWNHGFIPTFLSAKGRIANCCRWFCRRCRTASEENDAFTTALQEEVAARRLHALQRTHSFVSFALNATMIARVYNTLNAEDRFLSGVHDVALLVAYGIFLLTKLYPDSINNSRTVYAWYFMWWVVTVVSSSPYALEHNYIIFFCIPASILRFIWGAFLLDVLVSVPCDFVISVVLTYNYRINAADSEFRMFAMCEFCSWLFIAVALCHWQEMVVADAGQRLYINSTKSEHLAALSLLDLVCDAVVEIDDDLRCIADAPKLSTILHRNTNSSLANVHFANFIKTEEDKRRFEGNMKAKQGEKSWMRADMMYVQLSDSFNLDVRVALYYVHFLFPGKRVYHLVGLQEQGDQSRADDGWLRQQGQKQFKSKRAMGSMTMSVPENSSLRNYGNFIGDRCATLGASTLKEPTNADLFMDDRSSVSSFGSMGSVSGNATVGVNVFTSDLDIMFRDDEFISLGGPSAGGVGTPLLSWIESRKKEFHGFIQTSINVFYDNREQRKFGPYSVELSPPGLNRASGKRRIRYMAECYVSISNDVQSIEDLEANGARILFSEIKMSSKRRQAQGSPRGNPHQFSLKEGKGGFAIPSTSSSSGRPGGAGNRVSI
eukprot:TRINITY_DN25230_c0_g1_i1.p1 TRINITY_DN25230_c0_g1~~TRINITY_DN25230_c0_g1_i1.p1  ORF type:complete len:636 (-),score=112.70 TRINITY_DN25230_c0_g1_i1:61-1968(-)